MDHEVAGKSLDFANLFSWLGKLGKSTLIMENWIFL